jgi:hypothetical protein
MKPAIKRSLYRRRDVSSEARVPSIYQCSCGTIVKNDIYWAKGQKVCHKCFEKHVNYSSLKR